MKILAPKNGTGAGRLPRWRWLALLVMLVGLGAWGLGKLNHPPPPPPKPPPSETPSRMETLSLTEIQEGDKRWVLEGQKADISQDQERVNLSGVRVEFFGPGEHLKVKADEGLFHTKTRILTLTGNVEMEQGDLLVKTSVATYDPNSRVLVSPEEVVLSKPTLRIQGKGLRVWLAEKRMVLSQHRLTEVKVQEGVMQH
jgi:LPS export ABC transporter protein LptC